MKEIFVLGKSAADKGFYILLPTVEDDSATSGSRITSSGNLYLFTNKSIERRLYGKNYRRPDRPPRTELNRYGADGRIVR